MVRWAATLAFTVGFGVAPFQCGHGRTQDGSSYREDRADDALWALAERFRAQGNEGAAQDTLKFLLERYPASRHAPHLREQFLVDSGTTP